MNEPDSRFNHLLRNARTFDRLVVQWYFEDWAALALVQFDGNMFFLSN